MPGKSEGSPDLDWVRKTRVMTLGVWGQKGPWVAPVYYLFENQRFYFFSNPESRHVRDGADQPCAAAVFQDPGPFEQIRGLQMTGTLGQVRAGLEGARIALAYGQRFRIRIGQGNALEHFARVFHAALYAFIPEMVYETDNQRGFGDRRQIRL